MAKVSAETAALSFFGTVLFGMPHRPAHMALRWRWACCVQMSAPRVYVYAYVSWALSSFVCETWRNTFACLTCVCMYMIELPVCTHLHIYIYIYIYVSIYICELGSCLIYVWGMAKYICLHHACMHVHI